MLLGHEGSFCIRKQPIALHLGLAAGVRGVAPVANRVAVFCLCILRSMVLAEIDCCLGRVETKAAFATHSVALWVLVFS